jgi:hypothetical protein
VAAYVAGGGVGAMRSCRLAQRAVRPAKAAWTPLLQNNPDPRPAIAAVEIRADQMSRRYYAGLSLWLTPARPPPAARWASSDTHISD